LVEDGRRSDGDALTPLLAELISVAGDDSHSGIRWIALLGS